MGDWKRNRVHVLRAERRWTQTRLAAMVGVNQSMVSEWENAIVEPTDEQKKKLKRAFKLADVADLLTPTAQAVAS